MEIIKSKLSKADTSKFISKIDECNRIIVRLKGERRKEFLLFNSDGEVNKEHPRLVYQLNRLSRIMKLKSQNMKIKKRIKRNA